MKQYNKLALLFLLTNFYFLSCGVGSIGLKARIHDSSSLEITFAAIPGGTFQMGDEVGDLWDGCRPVHKVTVSGFKMGVYEVTNAQYAAYLNSALASGEIEMKSGDVYGKTGEWSGERYIDIGYDYGSGNKCWIDYSSGRFTVTGGKEYWPVVAVSWYGAKSFALYYGLDLPTEAEWEYAARGGKQYSYGTDNGAIDSTRVNYDMYIGSPTPVGAYPANPFGLYDMSGNVWEWCLDWYGSYLGKNVKNPTGAQSGTVRIIRDGTWDNKAFKCRVAYRGRFLPKDGDYGLGFRVVRRH
ncbi:MAG: formylglycine-generating enzyme family protein [Candidatus Latescibacterota bacterium]